MCYLRLSLSRPPRARDREVVGYRHLTRRERYSSSQSVLKHYLVGSGAAVGVQYSLPQRTRARVVQVVYYELNG